MDKITSHKALVTRFFKALNQGDMDEVMAIYASDAVVHTLGNTLISGSYGKEEIRNFGQGILEAFPNGLRFKVITMTAEEDRVAVEAVSNGEHVSGKQYNNEYHFLFNFRDGQLVSLREYMDTEHLTDVLCNGQRPPFEHSEAC